jgi:5-(aminomethyl)-3-furanmethanol phosphate kinase
VGGGRVAIVPGGAAFADTVRQAQAHWGFNNLAAHNMAVLAMAQTAYQLNAINPALQLVAQQADIRRLLRTGRTALWLPLELQSERQGPRTNWGATSDTIALDLARSLNAERLVVVKSCAIDARHSLVQLGEGGIIDRQFAARASGADFAIEVIAKTDLPRMRAMLLGTLRPVDV